MHINSKLLLILLVTSMTLVGCSGWPSVRAKENKPQDPPDVIVQRFYNWYLDDTQADPKDARQSGVLTEDLSTRIDAATPGNSINFVCAQDFPDRVSVGTAIVEGEKASVPVETSWGGRLQIRLILSEGSWLIDDVQYIH